MQIPCRRRVAASDVCPGDRWLSVIAGRTVGAQATLRGKTFTARALGSTRARRIDRAGPRKFDGETVEHHASRGGRHDARTRTRCGLGDTWMCAGEQVSTRALGQDGFHTRELDRSGCHVTHVAADLKRHLRHHARRSGRLAAPTTRRTPGAAHARAAERNGRRQHTWPTRSLRPEPSAVATPRARDDPTAHIPTQPKNSAIARGVGIGSISARLPSGGDLLERVLDDGLAGHAFQLGLGGEHEPVARARAPPAP